MTDKQQSDETLMDLMARLCHQIAFETAGEDASEVSGPELTPEEKERIIDRLFDLTNQGKSSEKIASLAESFGLMLVKLEARDVKQADLIDALRRKNMDLEAARQALGEQNRTLKDSLREKYRPALSLSGDARACLMAYDWPGNVRELNNEMERAAALTVSDRVEVTDLSDKLSGLAGSAAAVGGAEPGPAATFAGKGFNLELIKQQVVDQALSETGGNKTKAAALLGITREGLRKHLLKVQGKS